MNHRTLQVYKREDGKWAWRLKAANGQVIATDGGQGYENKAECEEMAIDVLSSWTHHTVRIERE